MPFFVICSETYITKNKVDVYDEINGEIITQWPDRTLFTAKVDNQGWLTVTGTFPEAIWQPIKTPIYVINNDDLNIRPPYEEEGGATIIYQPLISQGSKAKAYMLQQDIDVFLSEPIKQQNGSYLPDYQHYEQWPKGKRFTARYENRFYLKVTGHFPEIGTWQALDQPRWIFKPVQIQDRTQPRPFAREEKTKRYAVIDKTDFQLILIEVKGDAQTKLLSTPVALGYDRCLSKEKGGKCYYTPEGVFDIEFKLFDPDGIEWCVPPKMEAEFAEKIAAGQRCWRGIMGRHALHFGNSLFLHGTSNPSSIGSRTTHGCVRLRNKDIDLVYRLLKEGDKVIITESFESLDLLNLGS